MPTLSAIAKEVKGDFIVAGSYPAAVIAAMVTPYVQDLPTLDLPFNDIDCYHGDMVGDGEGSFRLGPPPFPKKIVQGIEKEVNYMKGCVDLNLKSLISGSDINAVRIGVKVSALSTGEISSTAWEVSRHFWQFIFYDRILRVVRTDTPAQSLVRLVYKHWQLGVLSSAYGVNQLLSLTSVRASEFSCF